MASFAGGVLLGVTTQGRVNYCKGYGSPQQLLLNGTIFLVCNPSVEFGVMSEDDKLALGLGLGIGVPLGLVLIVLLWRWTERRQQKTVEAWTASSTAPV